MGKGSVVLVAVVFMVFMSCCCRHGSGDMQVLKESRAFGFGGKKKMKTIPSGYFMGFLPRGMPIPPSGPSKQHDSIGLRGKKITP